MGSRGRFQVPLHNPQVLCSILSSVLQIQITKVVRRRVFTDLRCPSCSTINSAVIAVCDVRLDRISRLSCTRELQEAQSSANCSWFSVFMLSAFKFLFNASVAEFRAKFFNDRTTCDAKEIFASRSRRTASCGKCSALFVNKSKRSVRSRCQAGETGHENLNLVLT